MSRQGKPPAPKFKIQNTQHMDLYHIMGLDASCTQEQLDLQYSALQNYNHASQVKRRHMIALNRMINQAPNRQISDDKQAELDQLLSEKQKESAEMLVLIVGAYNRLTNDRANYDRERNQRRAAYKDDGSALREDARAYMKAQRTEATEQDQATFKAAWEDMNRKHGFQGGFQEGRMDRQYAAMNEADTKKRLAELQAEREKMDKDTLPEMLNFKPDNLNGKDLFNAAFEQQWGSPLRGQTNPTGAIAPYGQGFGPGLGADPMGMSGLGSLSDYGNLYASGTGDSFAPLLPTDQKPLTKEMMAGIVPKDRQGGMTDADRAEQKRKLQEYNNFTGTLDNRSIADFSTEYEYPVVSGLEETIGRLGLGQDVDSAEASAASSSAAFPPNYSPFQMSSSAMVPPGNMGNMSGGGMGHVMIPSADPRDNVNWNGSHQMGAMSSSGPPRQSTYSIPPQLEPMRTRTTRSTRGLQQPDQHLASMHMNGPGMMQHPAIPVPNPGLDMRPEATR
jgi:hypothetical protein